MKRLFAIIILLALCRPVYGEVLVYHISGSTKGIDVETGNYLRQQLRGYFVLEVSISQVKVNSSALIFIGSEASNAKIQETIPDIVFEFRKTTAASGSEWLSIELYDELYGIYCVLTGNAKSTEIGSANKENVAKGFNGNIVISGTLPLIDRDARSSGPIKLKLDANTTKDANKKTMSFLQVVADLQSKLLNSGYQYY
jgi:hypothetical protein